MTYWDDNATSEGVFNPPAELYDSMTGKQADYIMAQIGVCELVADVGCGIGRLIGAMHERDPQLHIIGVDSSPAMLATAAILHPDEARWILSDGSGLPDCPPFDGAWCVLMLQHVPDDDVALSYLRGIRDRLEVGGRLVSQWVVAKTDEKRSEYSYARSRVTIDSLFDEAGLIPIRFDDDSVVTGYSPEWLWITAERPLP